jgi:hypothetical protein
LLYFVVGVFVRFRRLQPRVSDPALASLDQREELPDGDLTSLNTRVTDALVA